MHACNARNTRTCRWFATACAQYSASGSALLLPLRPSRSYAAELAMFGGVAQFIDSGGGCFCDSPASNKAYRIRLDDAAVFGNAGWGWAGERAGTCRVALTDCAQARIASRRGSNTHQRAYH